jgi:uncharacterized protein
LKEEIKSIFIWDERKASSNKAKHGVSFQEASTVFGDPLAITYDDPDHSEDEDRMLTFGLSLSGNFLVVSHTERSGTIRIISARKMSKNERKLYEED